jgi:hypothetical protein
MMNKSCETSNRKIFMETTSCTDSVAADPYPQERGSPGEGKMHETTAYGAKKKKRIGCLQRRGSRLIMARALWLALVVPSLGLFVASLPVYYAQIQRPCVDPVTCNVTGTLTARGLQELPALGLSGSGYAALLTLFFTLIVTIWSGVGFLIFWRRSDEWFALFSACFLVLFNTTYPGFPISALALASPALDVPITFMNGLGLASIILFLMLFPCSFPRTPPMRVATPFVLRKGP